MTTTDTQAQIDVLAGIEHECPDSPKACRKYHVRTPLFLSLRRECDESWKHRHEHENPETRIGELVLAHRETCKGWLPVEVGDVDLTALMMDAAKGGMPVSTGVDTDFPERSFYAYVLPAGAGMTHAATPSEAVIDAISAAVTND